MEFYWLVSLHFHIGLFQKLDAHPLKKTWELKKQNKTKQNKKQQQNKTTHFSFEIPKICDRVLIQQVEILFFFPLQILEFQF